MFLVIVVSDVFGDCCLVMLCVFKIDWAARFVVSGLDDQPLPTK